MRTETQKPLEANSSGPDATATSISEEKLIQRGLSCPICIEFLSEPLLLACGHSFCRVCLLQSSFLAPDGRHCPNCRRPIELKDPASHPADATLVAQIQEIVPANEIEARKAADKQKLAELLERAEKSLPIFYMRGVASRVGQRVNLHFFEPRYRILIRRAWEGNHRFICTQRQPSEGDGGLIVEVESAVFHPDGKADIKGRGVQLATLRNVRMEDGTAGLYYCDVESLVVSSARSSPSLGSSQAGAGQGTGDTSVEERVQILLRLAIQKGAPRYNRGDHAGCLDTYRETASRCLDLLEDAESSRSPMAVTLRRGQQDAAAAVGNSRVAAWAFRHAFDDVLAVRPSQGGDSHPVPGGDIEERELPVFYLSPGTSSGSSVQLRFFEPRYQILARTVWAAPDRLFIYASSVPTDGDTAHIVRLESCRWDERNCASVRGLAVGRVSLGAVRQETSEGGLYYAKGRVRADIVQPSTARRQDGKAVKCCSVQ